MPSNLMDYGPLPQSTSVLGANATEFQVLSSQTTQPEPGTDRSNPPIPRQPLLPEDGGLRIQWEPPDDNDAQDDDIPPVYRRYSRTD